MTISTLIWLAIAVAWLAGVLSALHAVQEGRAAEGTVAWVFALVTLAPLTVPFYWMFALHHRKELFSGRLEWPFEPSGPGPDDGEVADELPDADLLPLKNLSPFQWRFGCRTKLLINGEATYEAIHAAIDGAEREILVHYYTIRTDRAGSAFLERLSAAVDRGVRVCLLYDSFGSEDFHKSDERRDLVARGAEVHPFNIRFHGIFTRWHINFRNHRKLCLVDGRIGFTGGINIGDEYLGRKPRVSPWRDTHLCLHGPIVRDLRVVFERDWLHTVQENLEEPPAAQKAPEENERGAAIALAVPMGPETDREYSTLMVLEALRLARRRVWITTPFLAPGAAIGSALEQTVLRGVEVRIFTTAAPDRLLSFYANWFFAEKLRRAGVEIVRAREGFVHEKVFLVDDRLAGVGTMNLDNRSLRLNFEIVVLLADTGSIEAVEAMLEKDFTEGVATEGEWERLGRRQRLLSCVARLFAPVL
ncbi:MAG: phospholipase D-like domain-containing protein [Opitutales bacterium]